MILRLLSYSLALKVILVCGLLAVCVVGCKGRNEGEVTFPPRKFTKPMGMISAPNDAPAYTFVPKKS
jgi:hypothetical protein